MSEKFDLTNNQFDITKYGLKGEDIYNIAKCGKKSVSFKTRMAARALLLNVLNSGNSSDEAQFLLTMLSTRLFMSNKEMDIIRERIITEFVDTAIEKHGTFNLEEDYVAVMKIARKG